LVSCLEDLRKGETLKRVIEKQDLLKETLHMFGELFSASKTKEELDKEKEKGRSVADESAMKLIQEKLSKNNY
jgi:hypothetical protein